MNDELSIVVGGRKISGWTEIRVSRGIERLPSDFDIGMTERFPGDLHDVIAKPGDSCQVLIGSDLVITGYIDRFIPSISAYDHSIRISGRGKCQDLVDCSAEWPNNQISGGSALAIAQKIAKPYGITVSADVDVGGPIPQFNLMWGETGYEIIERISRYRALLAYDMPDGNLLLSRVGSASHSSGVKQGANVLSANMLYSMDQRFSEYMVYLQSMDVLHDVGSGGNLLARKTDDGVPRHRRRALIAEAGGGGLDISIKRANWEAARRMGRSMQLSVDVDNWRDGAGKLWTPNQLIPIDIPSLKTTAQNWLIGEVSFLRGNEGSYAALQIMPPDAFNPEPILLQPVFADVPAIAPAAQ